jgi:hypothetical protein
VHDGLQDGGERGHPDAGTDQDGVLSSEYLDFNLISRISFYFSITINTTFSARH